MSDFAEFVKGYNGDLVELEEAVKAVEAKAAAVRSAEDDYEQQFCKLAKLLINNGMEFKTVRMLNFYGKLSYMGDLHRTIKSHSSE